MSSSTPNTPNTPTAASRPDIKTATPDLQIFSDELVPIEIMTDLIFENIGGQELIDISRHDLVNGQDIIYQPIKNVSSVYFSYNPQNMIKLQDTSESYFKNFPIRLGSKIPDEGTGPNKEVVYIDNDTGDLVINVYNMEPYEQVEVQILTSGTLLDGTIYIVEQT